MLKPYETTNQMDKHFIIKLIFSDQYVFLLDIKKELFYFIGLLLISTISNQGIKYSTKIIYYLDFEEEPKT